MLHAKISFTSFHLILPLNVVKLSVLPGSAQADNGVHIINVTPSEQKGKQVKYTRIFCTQLIDHGCL